MADVALLDHCGFSVPDVRQGVEFFEKVLGARVQHWNSLTSDNLGNAPHVAINLGEFFFVMFPHSAPPPPPDRPRGLDGSRHGYVVPRGRFAEVVERLREHNVPMEGPVAHPEASPIGESVYFTDPGGNFQEICWRRDREEERAAARTATGRAEGQATAGGQRS